MDVEVGLGGKHEARRIFQRWLLGGGNLIAVLVVYFAVPLNTNVSDVRMVINLFLTVAGVGVVAAIVVRQVRSHVMGTESGVRGLHLILLLEVVFVLFAITVYSLAVNLDNQFEGVATRIDALYFTAATMATVGYGDAHPVGQVSRAVVTGQLIFDVIFLAALASLIKVRLPAVVKREEGPS